MTDEPAFVYDATRNPQGEHLDGVPLRDLTRMEYDELPEVWQRAVTAVPYYVANGDTPPALVSIDGVGEEITRALANAGYSDWTAVSAATDDDLLKISGIGKTRLSHIRAAIADHLGAKN